MSDYYGHTFDPEIAKSIAIRRCKAIRYSRKYYAFILAHPEVKQLEREVQKPIHQRNTFVHDVMGKLSQYGSLSDKQLAAVKTSMQRDVDRQARWEATKAEERKHAGPAPSGRVVVTGTVLSAKQIERGNYVWSDEVTKLLVKLENGSKVYVSEPKGLESKVGDTVTFKATFTPKDDDTTFAFGSRPYVVN